MSDRVLCPECGMEHLSSERNCTYCGYDLTDLIVDFKDKHLPISFNNEEKKEIKQKAQTKGSTKVKKIPSKSRKITYLVINIFFAMAIIISSIIYGLYPDKWLNYDELTFGFLVSSLIVAFLISLIPLIRVNKLIASDGRAGCCTRHAVFTKVERDQRPMKVKKVPSTRTSDSLLIFAFLMTLGGISIAAILSFTGSSDINYIGFIIMGIGFLLFIPYGIVRSLAVTKGRAYCFSSLYPSVSQRTNVEECITAVSQCLPQSGCGIGFMIFFIDLISILFKK